jgi:hypothetical protein
MTDTFWADAEAAAGEFLNVFTDKLQLPLSPI